MDDLTPSLDEWSRLYQAAIKVKEVAPWEWMTETEVFGVQNPETDEIGFVSVMGMLGEHYSLAVYLGAEGLYGLWRFEDAASSGDIEDGAPEDILQIPHLQASFENRNELTNKDRDIIKQLGLKFRGRQAWPLFRSYRPGFYPWYLEAHEVRFLAYALEQVVDVAMRCQANPEILTPGDDQTYLVRVSQGEDDAWEDRIVTVPPLGPASVTVMMDVDALEMLKRMPPRQVRLEIDLFMFPGQIGERGERPYYAYMLLVVESTSGVVLGTELLRPDPTMEAMYGMIPVTLVHLFARMGIVPGEIRVRSKILFQLLELLRGEIGFRIHPTPTLPSLDYAKDFLMQRFY